MTFADITIGQYQRVVSSIKVRGLDNNFELGMDIIEIFEGVDRKEMKGWTVDYFNERMNKYGFMSDTSQLTTAKWVKEIKLGKDRYKVNQTPETWNVGQYVSINSLIKDESQILNNTHIIIAAMCCKDEDNIVELSKRFQNELSIAVAYPIALFFCAVMLNLPSDIKAFIQGVNQIGSEKSGVGMK